MSHLQQLRLPTIITASLLLLLVLTFSAPTYATEINSPTLGDHNFQRIPIVAGDVDWGDLEDHMYEPEFNTGGIGRELRGRAADLAVLQDGVPITLNLGQGQTVYYVFEKAVIWANGTSGNKTAGPLDGLPKWFGKLASRDVQGKSLDNHAAGQMALMKRQDANTKQVFISVNTCGQPAFNGSKGFSPQLTLYLSTTNHMPGPGQSDSTPVPFMHGFVNATLNATSDQSIYMGVSAPNITAATGSWNFAIAASTSSYYFGAIDDLSGAFIVDTDQRSALIVSRNLTDPASLAANPDLRKQWLENPPPFTLFVVQANSTGIGSVSDSFCGIKSLSQSQAGIRINSTITLRNHGGNPKQQFYVEGLNPGTDYWAVLAWSNANNVSNVLGGVTSGGRVWQPFKFTTKTGKLKS
jgi:calcium channel MID1